MIEILRPIAPGDENAIDSQTPADSFPPTDHWNKVDEADPDDGATYLSANADVWRRDLYSLPAPTGSGVINKITVFFRIRDNAYSGEIAKPCIKSDGIVTEGTAINPGGIFKWETYSQEWLTNPADGKAWEWSDIDLLQVGISLYGQRIGLRGLCTQVYVELDYTLVYHLEVAINGEGLVLPEDVIGDYWEGSVIGLTAAPAPGWYFHSWEGTDNNSINPTTVTMDSDKHVVCNFTQVAPAGCLPIVAAVAVLIAGIIAGIIIAFI